MDQTACREGKIGVKLCAVGVWNCSAMARGHANRVALSSAMCPCGGGNRGRQIRAVSLACAPAQSIRSGTGTEPSSPLVKWMRTAGTEVVLDIDN